MSEPNPAAELFRLSNAANVHRKKVRRNFKVVGACLAGVAAAFITEAVASEQPVATMVAAVGAFSCLGVGVIAEGKVWYHSLRQDEASECRKNITAAAFEQTVHNHPELAEIATDMDILPADDPTEDSE